MDSDDEIFTITDAARLLNISQAGVRYLVDKGELPVVRTARGLRLFNRRDVLRVAAARDAARHARQGAA